MQINGQIRGIDNQIIQLVYIQNRLLHLIHPFLPTIRRFQGVDRSLQSNWLPTSIDTQMGPQFLDKIQHASKEKFLESSKHPKFHKFPPCWDLCWWTQFRFFCLQRAPPNIWRWILGIPSSLFCLKPTCFLASRHTKAFRWSRQVYCQPYEWGIRISSNWLARKILSLELSWTKKANISHWLSGNEI